MDGRRIDRRGRRNSHLDVMAEMKNKETIFLKVWKFENEFPHFIDENEMIDDTRFMR